MEFMKKWGKVVINVLSAIMLVVGLAFNAVVISSYGIKKGFTGFYCFDYAGNGSKAGTIGIFGIISIVVAVVVLIYTIYAYMKNKRMCVGIVLGVLCSVAYMIVCFACTTGSTAGFVPAIIQVVFALCYYLIHRQVQKDNGTMFASQTQTVGGYSIQSAPMPVNPEVESQKNNISLLKEYKTLLDSGIISQEEFDQKKAQLFGK